MSTLDIQLPRYARPLLEPSRYKGLYGGRGSSKSWTFAGLLIKDSLAERGLLSLCVREVQKSLMQSAKRLIEQRLAEFNLGEADGFKAFREVIQTPGDGLIVFAGMQDHTADSIKSYEGFRRAWAEEAHSLSERSLTLLRPTIRAADSELWFSWNPRLKTDPVDVLLRGANPPTGSVVIQANWRDNPWFPPVLEQERKDCEKNDPDQYAHIWEGEYVQVVKGAYYAEQLAAAKSEGRIGRVGADPLLSYRVFCDIGGTGAKADAFAMWVAQFVGKEIRVLNSYEAQGQEIGEHIGWLNEHGYKKGKTEIVLPHDGGTNDRVYNVSYESAFRAAGYSVTVIPNQGAGAASARIQQARRLFPRIWFNEATTEIGRAALGWYHEKRHETLDVGMGPEHDWASHSADAFGLMAVAYKPPTTSTRPDRRTQQGVDYSGTGY